MSDPYLADAMKQAKSKANHFGNTVEVWLTVAGKDKAYTLRNKGEWMDEKLWSLYAIVGPDDATCPACGRRGHVVCNKL